MFIIHSLNESKIQYQVAVVLGFNGFLTSRNICYGISLRPKQKHEFVLESIGKKVPQSALCVWVYSLSDTIYKGLLKRDAIRKAREAFLISKGKTLKPSGLNWRDEI